MSRWLMKVGAGARRARSAGPSKEDQPPRLRVIALPHAGGWPSAFRSWWQVLPDDVEFLVAQLPGRGPRISEPPWRRVEPLVEGLSRALAELEPLPYAVIGHSFGSVLAYELTRAMEHKGLPPRLLAVSARQPPSFPSEPPFAHLRSDAELLEHLVGIGGISPELISRSDLVQPSLRAIRADLEAMEKYQRPMLGTAVPIMSLGAEDDPVVIAERLHLWSLETSGAFNRLMFTGGHFYLYAPRNAATIVNHLIVGLDGLWAGSSANAVPSPLMTASGSGRNDLGKELA
ncbi:thioesterase [Streptomyces lunaelactis]|nr:thioesterase [Streptomyces lunaelactis]NUK32644.1 thioesterase [Streptomyces lunaelactis]NUK40876.1 thioesterase [Streptomyces lunaelactis]NUK49983.1 thioesterase [Streptomyces lunaelactis]NUK55819.1 thioesterase [Streptomyces lunaelactis]